MASYEKQQPPPPPPPVNAAPYCKKFRTHNSNTYYAYPAPQQPYYAPQPPPPPAPRRSGPGCLLCFVFKVIALVVIALGAAVLVLWLILRPGAVRATAVSATLSRFDLADGVRAGEGVLQYNLTVDVRVRNPNRFRIHYEYAEAQASYDGERFGYHPVQPFYLERKGERTVTAAFAGSSAVDDRGALRSYRRERGDGFYYVKVRLYADLGFKVRVFNARRKSKITCTLRLPVPNASAAPVPTMLGTRCAVDF
ncbi:NDR1/HIN1-like protein 10 [Triticum aestivum]|uniref:NDR1/HIN1-like protein 10 n=1 Tax=Triticum aestivum TaxID=4565 RepID=UPI001D024AE2|nr:NDR1/HIN1-like protein 10 [Triticum aestivum]